MTAFLVLVALCFFGPRILARARIADAHLIHRPGECPDGICNEL